MSKEREKNERLVKQEIAQSLFNEGLKRRTEKINLESLKLETIKLKSKNKPHNAYFNNSEVFIAFYLEDAKLSDPKREEVFPVPEPYEGYKMFEFDFKNMPSNFNINLAIALDKGNLLVYSKVEGKLVSEIKRLDKGPLRNNMSGIMRHYQYYLPDGTLFFDIMNFHVSYDESKRIFENNRQRSITYP